jgi:hypothetical protein
MKRQYLRILTALIGFAALGVTAKAQEVDQIVVKIPFEFSVVGKTLPAGTYRVNRISSDPNGGLVLRSVENHTGALVLPTYSEGSVSDKPEVTFEKAGDEHFLTRIKTGDHVFSISVSKAEILEAAAKSPSGGGSGSSSGNN